MYFVIPLNPIYLWPPKNVYNCLKTVEIIIYETAETAHTHILMFSIIFRYRKTDKRATDGVEKGRAVTNI